MVIYRTVSGENLSDIREQTQEDIITYMNGLRGKEAWQLEEAIDSLCQIVVDNFEKVN